MSSSILRTILLPILPPILRRTRPGTPCTGSIDRGRHRD
ncbi:protein of unassigned function [Methylobacterium oryzae CBMB20]|uniref:Protein of unassigned function n=1 Tax=Methylobacterium oryzae CBMB20 TaxID=693986 RepID=A0A089P7I4_9HYPH|nr:protein of unassigned function [Methylobacterium oryzae CBMB20]